MRVIDLSMTITQDHFRWKSERRVMGDLKGGDQFQASWLTMSCHAFSHVDARGHILPDGATIEQTPLDRMVGPCRVINLEGIAPNTEITAEMLRDTCPNLAPGSRVLMRSCWTAQRSCETPEFWTDAPFMSKQACLWLLERDIITIGFDFPQDWPIRLSVQGGNETVPFDQHVTHDILLRHGVTLVEYLVNTSEISQDEILLIAAPLKLANADGAPARVLAIEGLDSELLVQ